MLKRGDLVIDRADPRHVGLIEATSLVGKTKVARILWLESKWRSFRVPMEDLRRAPKDQQTLTECGVMRRALNGRRGHADSI